MVTVAVSPLPLHHLSLDLWHYEGKEEDGKRGRRRRRERGEVFGGGGEEKRFQEAGHKE